MNSAPTSENYPSRDCLEIPNGHRFGLPRACPMGRKGASRHRFALPNPRRTIPPAIFQTVSLERLSGNSERAPLRGLTSLRNRTKGHHLDASRYRKTRDPTRAASFQTVSLRRWVNRGKKKGQGLWRKPWPLRAPSYGFCPGGAWPAGFWFSVFWVRPPP